MSFQCLLCVYISHNKFLNYSGVSVIPLPKSLFDTSTQEWEVSTLPSNLDLCLIKGLTKGHKAHSLSSDMQSIPAFSEVQVLTNNTAAMYYFMRQEGTWLFAVIGAVSILLQQWLCMFLAFRAPWQIGRHFLGTQGNMPYMGIPRDKSACCMPELHISNIHFQRGNVSIFPLGGLSHPLAWCVTFYSSWCYQLSDKMGQTQAGHVMCIMGGADHVMRSVEDLCSPIVPGLLDTFIE